MNHFEPKLITPEYLLKNGFEQVNYATYCLILEIEGFHPIIIHADCEPNCFVLSMTIKGCNRFTILPIETEFQLNKLINALQGK